MDSFASVSFLVSSVSDISECLPLIIWYFFSKKEGPYAVLGVFFMVSALLKVYTLITAELGIHNMPVFHVLACLEIVLLYIFYTKLTGTKLSYWIIGILVLFNVLNSALIQDISHFNSVAWTINMMILLGIGLSYLFSIYNNENDLTPLEMRPDFIITAGWLIYASGSLFTYLMGTEILSGKAEGFFKNAWIFQAVSNIVKNIIISYGLWLTKRVASLN